MNSYYQKGQDLSRRVRGWYLFLFHWTALLISAERYANTDDVVVRSMSHNLDTKMVASYDIMCQWSKNLHNCLKDFPLENAECLDDQIVARVVPKFHLAAHKEDC